LIQELFAVYPYRLTYHRSFVLRSRHNEFVVWRNIERIDILEAISKFPSFNGEILATSISYVTKIVTVASL
jgi:hypothetical protein